jgi:hypothetical protein
MRSLAVSVNGYSPGSAPACKATGLVISGNNGGPRWPDCTGQSMWTCVVMVAKRVTTCYIPVLRSHPQDSRQGRTLSKLPWLPKRYTGANNMTEDVKTLQCEIRSKCMACRASMGSLVYSVPESGKRLEVPALFASFQVFVPPGPSMTGLTARHL